MLHALKELNGSKLRYVLMVAVVTLMVWLVIFLVAMAEGLADETTSLFKNMPADYYVFSEKSDNILSKTLLEKKTINDLKKIEGVKDVTYLSYQPATLTDAENVKEDAALFAIEGDGFIAPQIIEGRSLDKQNTYGVVADNRLKVNGYRLGSYFQVEGYNQPLTIVGFTKGNAYLYLPVVFIHNQTWQEIRFGEDKAKMGLTDPISIAVVKGSEAVTNNIVNSVEGIAVLSKNKVISEIPGFKQMDLSIKGMVWFIILIAGLVLAVFFYMITLQKTNQFGMLKAMGASNFYLMKTVVTQVMLITLCGLLLGIGLSYSIAALMPVGSMPLLMNTTLTIGYSIAIILIAFFSSILSLRHITKIDPLQAIGRVA